MLVFQMIRVIKRATRFPVWPIVLESGLLVGLLGYDFGPLVVVWLIYRGCGLSRVESLYGLGDGIPTIHRPSSYYEFP